MGLFLAEAKDKSGLVDDPQTRFLVEHLMKSLPRELFHGVNFEIHPNLYLDDPMGSGRTVSAAAAYAPEYDTLLTARNSRISVGTGKLSTSFSRPRAVALAIGHELGHRLEYFLGKEQFEQLKDQFLSERRELYGTEENPQTPSLTRDEEYRWSSMSEWFAHRFPDHVDRMILRPGQIDYFANPESPGHSVVNASLLKAQLVAEHALDRIKGIQLFGGGEPNEIDSFMRDFIKSRNAGGLTYRGTGTPARISNVHPLQLEEAYKNFGKQPEFDDWENRVYPPKDPRPIDQRQIKTNLGG